MGSIISCWPKMSNMYVASAAIEFEPSLQYPINLTTMQNVTIEQQSNKMTSDLNMPMKQKTVVKFLRTGKIQTIDINRYLSNFYEHSILNFKYNKTLVDMFQQ